MGPVTCLTGPIGIRRPFVTRASVCNRGLNFLVTIKDRNMPVNWDANFKFELKLINWITNFQLVGYLSYCNVKMPNGV